MGQIASRRALHTASGALLAALLGLLLVAPAAVAGKGGTASYEYKVAGGSYDATGELTGGKVADCVGVALWQGTVTTAESDLSDLNLGKASLKIHGDGSSGSIGAQFQVTSTLGDAFHRITTACDEFGSETDYTRTDCTSRPVDNPLRARVVISGGVGNRVTLLWNFFIPGGGGFLVSNVFNCVEPLRFPGRSPNGDICKTRVGLSKFTAKTVKLPFNCLYVTTTPPIGSRYSRYSSTASAAGFIMLKRTKQS